MAIDIYENYTSTSVFHRNNESKLTAWSRKYFEVYIRHHLGDNKNIKILEIGCGYGRYTKAIIDAGFHNIQGIDISTEQIIYAENNMGLKGYVQVADALEFLNNGQHYDVIFLMDVLEHLELQYSLELLGKISNALISRGKLVVHVPNGLSPLRPSFYNDVTHIRAFTVESLTQIFRMAGLEKALYFSLPPIIINVKGLIRRFLWSLLIEPMVRMYLSIANGSTSGGIHTPNILAVVIK